MGALVRLAFHDSAGDGLGPDGCIDFTNHKNKGLEEVVGTLNSLFVRKNYKVVISKADLIVLASIVAIEFASTLAVPEDTLFGLNLDTPPGPLQLPFRYGRLDALQCDDTGLLPSATLSLGELLDFFNSRYKMNLHEVVAIMGAHNLGRLQKDNSGFEGGWTLFQSSFGNLYYKTFSERPWHSDSPESFWLSNEQTILIPVDVELLYKSFGFGPQGFCNEFQIVQSTPNCPLQPTSSPIFIQYSTNMSFFFQQFTSAYTKMTEVKSPGLTSVGSELNTGYPQLKQVHGTSRPSPPTKSSGRRGKRRGRSC
jgi:catalase (peroxidase I)